MSGPGGPPMHLVVVLAVVSLPLVIGATLIAVLARRPDPAPSDAAAAARRHAGAVNVLALICLFASMAVGLGVLTGSSADGRQGIYLGLVPAAAGLAFAAVQGLGELTWPRPSGTIRRAPLTRRTTSDVAPGRLRRATWCWSALTAVTLVACGAASDDGRGITRTFTDGSAGAGPFPGWFYGVPLLLATTAVLLASETVLGLVARRPAVMDAAPEWDLGLRRTSSRRLLRGVQLVLGWTAAGVLFIAGAAVHSVGVGGSANGIATGAAGYAAVGIASMVLGVVAWLGSTAAVFLPARPVVADGAAALSPHGLLA
ncbi:hypothetical protein [Pengzhenrongella frigida]|uniref:Uncharacterized protein n=1 Tax=Pengzhenrongella frigida TaxID=1259133 RepID=A0A4Q5MZC8_9MICO|nr:hypothetical protein [Cellulomonas sp. HLT2-17]RYV51070.1 hypothetical protein EUA98_10525 [Cellulomonas sp. HLT2-17]